MISRRHLLGSIGGLLVTTGCSKSTSPASCLDVSGLNEDETTARTTLAYADRSADATKSCKACQQYVAPTKDGACGGCKLLKGPIHPEGSCKAFAPKG
jgi:hypothetical protein